MAKTEFVPLDRQFHVFRDDAERVGLYASDLPLLMGTGWATLMDYQRVVVLAAAGSGKSRELEAQAVAMRARGEFAFHATVVDVGRDGLEIALGREAARRLAAWRASDAVGWFFIDSVDEAKLDRVRFADAMKKLADGIGDAGLARARVILSGRYANWEFQADLETLLEHLPIQPPLEDREAEVSPLAALLDGTTRKRRQERGADKTQKPAVVLMDPLDLPRAERFAAGQGVTNHAAFMAAIAANNLKQLAQRPVDLGWLVAYWRDHQRFDTQAVMLEASLRARLVETEPDREARITFSPDRGMDALMRIGAAMVFGRESRLQLPDAAVSATTEHALRLNRVLPDWSGAERAQLIDLPVFDPAGPGRIQLHNDNEGEVRGFLAARWLRARIEAGASWSTVSDLLFAEVDGKAIVLPSVLETAAWLAIWNEDVAGEVVRRDPALLLTSGDPGSLPPGRRAAALEALVTQLLEGDERHPLLDRKVLQRFAKSDLAPALGAAWARGKVNTSVRTLLLQICEVGRLEAGLAFAREAFAAGFDDGVTQAFVARLIGVFGGPNDLEALAGQLKDKPEVFEPVALWEAAEAVFPRAFGVGDVLEMVRALPVIDKRGDQAWRGEQLVRDLTDPASIEELLAGLLTLVGPSPGPDVSEGTAAEHRLMPLIVAATETLLQTTPVVQASPAAIDGALRVVDGKHRELRSVSPGLVAALTASPARRRAALWQAAERLADHPWVGGRRHLGLTMIEHLAWPLGLVPEDAAWLAQDCADPARRELALEGLLRLWRNNGEPDALMARIEAAVAGDETAEQTVVAWRHPPPPNETETQFQAKMAEFAAQGAAKTSERLAGWVEFLDPLKADPTQLRIPPALKPGEFDNRLYNLWQLLRMATTDTPHDAIADFGVLADILGPELTAEARGAFIRYWREHAPTLSSMRPSNQRLQTRNVDLMGLVGVSMEAHSNPGWARSLSPQEAVRAAQFATLELRSLPAWLSDIAEVHPNEVGGVLIGEIKGQLRDSEDPYGILARLERVDPGIAALVAPALVARLEGGGEPSQQQLTAVLGVIARALPAWSPTREFTDFALCRFNDGEPTQQGSLYLGMAFRLDPLRAAEALGVRMDAMDVPAQKALAEMVLPKVFGDRLMGGGIHPRVLPFEALERLVRIAFTTVRVEEDLVHEGVYTPGPRDDAEMARTNLFNQLLATPGRATLEALRRLSTLKGFPIRAERMRRLILDRAAADAEASPWPAGEAFEQEKGLDAAPQTPVDLQRVAMRRIADIDHDLHHSQFSLARMVKRLPLELDAQLWAANELQHRQKRAYTVHREPEVADGKKPDIRLQSNLTDANIPIEIKLAERWSLRQLETAVAVQLGGQYLRERDLRHGVLLLVHRRARALGWRDGAGVLLSFAQVVAYLRSYADALARGAPRAPQVKIGVIDVTDIEDNSPDLAEVTFESEEDDDR